MNTPDKCPVCKAPVRTDHSKTDGFVVMDCGSHYGMDGKRQHQSSQCIYSERDQLAAWKDMAKATLNEWHNAQADTRHE